jgi:sporulation protein YlmC with PRC-barrel domain
MAKLEDLIPDDINANKGTEYGNSLIENSLRKFGAGRSILIDKNNHIIAGNKTVENAAAIGLENVRIIETDGKEIIAVKRTDIDLNTKIGRELALADNASAKANISWDNEAIEKLKENFDVDVDEWGVEIIKNIETDFNDLIQEKIKKDCKIEKCPKCGFEWEKQM